MVSQGGRLAERGWVGCISGARRPIGLPGIHFHKEDLGILLRHRNPPYIPYFIFHCLWLWQCLLFFHQVCLVLFFFLLSTGEKPSSFCLCFPASLSLSESSIFYFTRDRTDVQCSQISARQFPQIQEGSEASVGPPLTQPGKLNSLSTCLLLTFDLFLTDLDLWDPFSCTLLCFRVLKLFAAHC